MARKIIKKIGGDRIGSGNKMLTTAHGFGYSTHDVSKVRRTSMSFGTIVPMGIWMMTTGSRLRMRLDALITSNALLYQLYGSAKFQIDVFSARMALYNPKMLLNLNDQGYNINDIKFPLMELETKAINNSTNISNQQINASALLRYLGVSANGQNDVNVTQPVTRDWNAMWLLMYYQTIKEYYANKQEKKGVMIHTHTIAESVSSIFYYDGSDNTEILEDPSAGDPVTILEGGILTVYYDGPNPAENIILNTSVGGNPLTNTFQTIVDEGPQLRCSDPYPIWIGNNILNWRYVAPGNPDIPELTEYDLKAIDRMMMYIMSNVEANTAVRIGKTSELPYGASFQNGAGIYAINSTQEGLCVGTYQSDVFNNWLDNATINNLNAKSKVKVDENGEFSIDMLNLTQKLYNYDQRIGITDGTLDEWREMTYAQISKSKSLKPVYEGGLSKEIVFDMVVSTAATEEDPLGTIASRGQFGNKHKGGYVQIEGDEEKLVMVLAKITPRLVYNQGNDWTNNLKTLDDLHKPNLDKIGYQNLLTDQMGAFETRVKADKSLVTYSAGKQPAWQWYRTNYDDALGNMADTEDYKVFGRTYEAEVIDGYYRIKDLTTYIDPTKFNDVFAIQSLDAMNFDVQVGMDATLTLVMSEEVIPNL
ncbi:MAG: major capsid protein [Wigfec virus K19_83]|nr:MAG: major capsid protein [Wigfec virus K19_83]